MYSRLVFKIGLYSRAGYDGAYMVLNHGHFETNYRYLPLKKTNKVCRGISAQLRPSVRNQIYLVKLIPTQLTQASFLQKNKMWQNIFLDIFNAEIAQCRRKLDVILGTKVVQF